MGRALALRLLVMLPLLAGCAESAQQPQPTQPPVIVASATTGPTAVVVPTLSPTPTPPAPLAATVNGQYIFLADYERRVAQYQQALVDQGLDPSSEDGKARLAGVRDEVFDSLVNTILVEQKAAELSVTLTDAEIDAQVEADIQAGGGQAAFEEWLKATGQSRDDYRASLREAMLWQRVMDVVTAEVPATAEQVHVRHIVVDTKEAADRVLAQLQAGVDFAKVARESSLDVATKDNGGDMGWFPRGLVDPDLEAAAFGLQPGEISNPIQFSQGYRFVQVMEREAERPLSPEQQFDLKRATFERWLEEQRGAAAIDRFLSP